MDRFWETTSLREMTRGQWESLCDQCARCCLKKLENVESREIFYTNVACRLLDIDSCRCTDYANRSRVIPACVTLTPRELEDPYWLPPSCAYRLLAEGKALPAWHPLITGDPRSVVSSGHAFCGRVIPETAADDLEHHLIDWVY